MPRAVFISQLVHLSRDCSKVLESMAVTAILNISQLSVTQVKKYVVNVIVDTQIYSILFVVIYDIYN